MRINDTWSGGAQRTALMARLVCRWENQLNKEDIHEICVELSMNLGTKEHARRCDWDFSTASLIIEILESCGTGRVELAGTQTRLTKLLRRHVDFRNLQHGAILPNPDSTHKGRVNQPPIHSAKRVCMENCRVSSTDGCPRSRLSGGDDDSICASTPAQATSVEEQHERADITQPLCPPPSPQTSSSCNDGICVDQWNPNPSSQTRHLHSQVLNLQMRPNASSSGSVDGNHGSDRPFNMPTHSGLSQSNGK